MSSPFEAGADSVPGRCPSVQRTTARLATRGAGACPVPIEESVLGPLAPHVEASDEAVPPDQLRGRFAPCQGNPEVKYYVSNADCETPLSMLALVACIRCRVEEFFEDCKSYLGMTKYETRSWVGWQHRMTLVGLARLFVTLARKRLQKRC
jgi:hypothetical protein